MAPDGRTWCEVAGAQKCKCCEKRRFVRLCPNYPKPPKSLSFRQNDDLQHFGPDWADKPYNVHWPTIEALLKRSIIERRDRTDERGWIVPQFRRVVTRKDGDT